MKKKQKNNVSKKQKKLMRNNWSNNNQMYGSNNNYRNNWPNNNQMYGPNNNYRNNNQMYGPNNNYRNNAVNNGPINGSNNNYRNNAPNNNQMYGPNNNYRNNTSSNNSSKNNRPINHPNDELKQMMKKINRRNFFFVTAGIIISAGIALGSSLPFVFGNESSLTNYTSTSTLSKSISFLSQPTNIDATVNSENKSFSVSVKLENLPDNAVIQYQWFSNERESSVNGDLIKGANRNVYFVPDQEMKTPKRLFYYCEASYDQFKIVSDVVKLTISDIKIQTQPIELLTTALGNTSQHSFSVTPLVEYPNDTNKLNYQWYSSQYNFISNTDKLISGANESTYKIRPEDVTAIGTKYFYCKIFYGNDVITVTSNISKFVVFQFSSDISININSLSPNKIVKVGTSTSTILSVDAFVNNPVAGESLHYQWYSNTTKSTTGATLIPEAIYKDYTVPVSDFHNVGIKYYYCSISYFPVTNTLTDFITIQSVTELPSITFTKQPVSGNVLPDKPWTIDVAAKLNNSFDGFNPTYQWYKSNNETNFNGVLLTGETNSSYSLKPEEVSYARIHNFYCVVSFGNISSTSDMAIIRVTDLDTDDEDSRKKWSVNNFNALTPYTQYRRINELFSSDYISKLINEEMYRSYGLKLTRFIEENVRIPGGDDALATMKKMIEDKSVVHTFRDNWTLFNIHNKATEQESYYSVKVDSAAIKGTFDLYTVDEADISYLHLGISDRKEFSMNIVLKPIQDPLKIAVKYYNVNNIWNITRTFDYGRIDNKPHTIVYDSTYSLNLSGIIQKYLLKIL